MRNLLLAQFSTRTGSQTSPIWRGKNRETGSRVHYSASDTTQCCRVELFNHLSSVIWHLLRRFDLPLRSATSSSRGSAAGTAGITTDLSRGLWHHLVCLTPCTAGDCTTGKLYQPWSDWPRWGFTYHWTQTSIERRGKPTTRSASHLGQLNLAVLLGRKSRYSVELTTISLQNHREILPLSPQSPSSTQIHSNYH